MKVAGDYLQNLVIFEQLRGRRSVAGDNSQCLLLQTNYIRVYLTLRIASLPGKLIRKEASKKSGRPVNEASDCSGNMYDFFSHMKSKSED
jgi:hypothetical protein